MTSGESPRGWASPAGPGPTPAPRPSWPTSAQPSPSLPLPSPLPPPPYGHYGQPYGQPGPPIPYGQPAQIPYQANPWAPIPVPPHPPPPPRRRRNAIRWVLGVVAVLLVCSVGAIGGLVGYADYTGALDVQASWRPAATPTNLPPELNAPASEWTNWARRSVDDAVDNQAEALLAADEPGFLVAVDPSNARLVAEHKRRFKVLRAMGPGVWTQALTGGIRTTGTREWRAEIKISYCFGDATCQAVELVVTTEWAVKNDHLVMVELEPSESQWNGPRPWETDDLSVGTGKRVVVAATTVNAWRLPDAVKAADRAAAVADTFAKWEKPPSRYVIFLAGPSDWKKWYGHSQPEWAAAWAVPVSSTVTEVVVRTQVVQQRGLETLLTHELTHVTTLAGKRDGAGRSAWWLIEGIADYATMVGQPVRSYDALPPTRIFVRGKWDGDPAVDPPTAGSSLEEASARYGVAFLAVRRMADRYGEGKMLNFFGRVVHDDTSVEAAAPAALGASWPTVRADCVKFIRLSVS